MDDAFSFFHQRRPTTREAIWEALQPYASEAGYVNYLEADQEGAARIGRAYGANYARLVALKDRYDPTNFFRRNQNIRPSQPTTSD